MLCFGAPELWCWGALANLWIWFGFDLWCEAWASVSLWMRRRQTWRTATHRRRTETHWWWVWSTFMRPYNSWTWVLPQPSQTDRQTDRQRTTYSHMVNEVYDTLSHFIFRLNVSFKPKLKPNYKVTTKFLSFRLNFGFKPNLIWTIQFKTKRTLCI